MAWKDFIRRNIKWLLGVFAWTVATRYLDQLWALFESVIFRLPMPSIDTTFWGIIAIGIIVVGSVLILSDVIKFLRARTRQRHGRRPLELPETPTIQKGIEPHPRVLVMPAEEDSKRFKEFQVRLKDGIEPVQAHIHFVTVKNLTGPSIRDLEVDFEVSNVKSQKEEINKGSFLMIFSSAANHLTLYCENMTVEVFRKYDDALRMALLKVDDGKLASRRTILHQGGIGKTFGLVMTLKDSPKLTIPSYHTRSTVWMPCSFRIDLYLTGDTFPSQCVASFQVDAPRWDAVTVTKVRSASLASVNLVDEEAHMKRQDERMKCAYAPLFSAVQSMRQREVDPNRGYTAGTPHTFWKDHPEIYQQVIDVFVKYPNLIENERVWNGWMRHESDLRKHALWIGKYVYDWFDAIEEEYHQIDAELKTRSPSS